MTRHACLAALLMVSFALPAYAKGRRDFRFADIPPNHWAVDHVRRVMSAGLMQSYEGKFLGNSPVNRYQMAQILSRMMDRMGNQSVDRDPGGSSNEVVLQIADEVASLNVAQSNLEEKVVQLRHDLEAVKSGESGETGRGNAHISDEEWSERIRTQAPAGFLLMAVFASANLLKSK